jgi:transposase
MDTIFGIDIADKTFVVFNEDAGHQQIENKKQGISAFLKALPQGSTIVIESTGGYGTLLADMAVKKKFTVYIVQPNKVKSFRRSGPMRSKTDRNDAQAIHDYFLAHGRYLFPYEPLPPFEKKLRQLARTKENLVKNVASIRLSLKTAGFTKNEIEETVQSVQKQIVTIEAKIDLMLKEAGDESQVIQSIPGVKANVTAFVLPVLRTVHFRDKHAFVSFTGFDLVLNESGNFKGKTRLSKQGDPHIRRALYLAAMAAARSRAFKAYYLSIIKEKKLKKVQALVVLARKLLRIIYGVYRSRKAFVAQT